MRETARLRPSFAAPIFKAWAFAALASTAALGLGAAPRAAELDLGLLDSIVKVETKISGDSRSAATLGTERAGSGVVIDGSGLVLTIGYLILEADEATIELAGGKTVSAQPVAYDQASGFGLLRANRPLGVKPIELGDSRKLQERDPVLVAGHGGREAAAPAYVVSRRVFAAPWEYLLEDAVFTAPAYANFGGAALIGTDGKLLGIGSLLVPDSIRPNVALPGNMFVPIEKLTPILADLLATGHSAGPQRPWLGMSASEVHGRLFVEGVQLGGPAAKAGLKRGDLVVGVGGEPIAGLADFYRKVWAIGEAGVAVPLQLLDGLTLREAPIRSIARDSWYKTGGTY